MLSNQCNSKHWANPMYRNSLPSSVACFIVQVQHKNGLTFESVKSTNVICRDNAAILIHFVLFLNTSLLLYFRKHVNHITPYTMEIILHNQGK